MLAADKKNVLTVFASMPFEIVKPGRNNARNAMPMGLIVGKLYPASGDRPFVGQFEQIEDASGGHGHAHAADE